VSENSKKFQCVAKKNLRPRAESVDFAWSDGSRFRGRFGFKFKMHVINYRCSGGHLKSDESSIGNVAHRFRTTRWTAVLLSAQSQAPGCQAALGELYRIYWYPLYAYVRRRGHTPEEAQDLTQGFFLHLLEHKTLARVDPLKGKFRSFLLGSLQNYLSTEADRASCLKRGGKVEFVSLEMRAAEDRYRLEPADQLSAEKIFEARWALILLEHALTVLGRQYAVRRKEAVFEILKSFIGIGASGPEASYETAGQRLGVGVGTVKTLIYRLRKQYMAVVREEVGRTVSDPAEIEDELRALCDALTATEGRLGL
jgi:RNA polymerase sigma factor (sigma-70 family)